MAFNRTGQPLKSPCIICKIRNGTIRTRDGLVCEHCMPKVFLKIADKISRDRIILYARVHDTWESCASDEELETGDSVSEDRSMAITLNDSVVLADEFNNQIMTSESIDLIVSFIKMSGLNLLLDSLREFVKKGKLRVITTAYMGVTEYEAIAELSDLPNTEIRMELESNFSHLHAKSYIFGRKECSTAYVGSANISKTALTSGEEWVVKLRQSDVPEVICDLRLGFEALWNSGHFEQVTKKNRAEIESALDRHGL